MHMQEKYSYLEYLETRSQQNARVHVLARRDEIMKPLHCDIIAELIDDATSSSTFCPDLFYCSDQNDF